MTSDQKRLHNLSSRHVETVFSVPHGFQWLLVVFSVLLVATAVCGAILNDQYIPQSLMMGWVGFLLLSPFAHTPQKQMYQARVTLLMVLGGMWFSMSEKMIWPTLALCLVLGLLLYATARLNKRVS